MKKSVLIIVSTVAFLSLIISCSNQSKASSNIAGMKTAFTIVSHPDYAEAAASVYKMYQIAQLF